MDRLGRLLLGAAVSRHAAAGDQGVAADGGHRRFTREHAARGRPGASDAATAGVGRVAGGVLSGGAEAVPLAIV